MAYYRFEDFVNACAQGSSAVVLIGTVVKDASECFNLKTTRAILDFIGNGGLEDLEFLNTKEWESNPSPTSPIMIDAYEFHTLNRLGYIAFFKSHMTGKWIIKSLHLSERRNPAMEIALRKAGLVDDSESRGK